MSEATPHLLTPAAASASAPPSPHGHDKLSEFLKQLPALIAALTALVTAIAAFRKPPDTTASRAGYEELSKAIEEVSRSNVKNHEDIVALHAYLKAYAEVLSTMKQAGPRAAGEGEKDSAAVGRGRRAAEEKPPALPGVAPEPRLVVPRRFKAVVEEAQTK
jgi:hypothetical protein